VRWHMYPLRHSLLAHQVGFEAYIGTKRLLTRQFGPDEDPG
jgi:hypothetical protein